jgi:hypothetical protein
MFRKLTETNQAPAPHHRQHSTANMLTSQPHACMQYEKRQTKTQSTSSPVAHTYLQPPPAGQQELPQCLDLVLLKPNIIEEIIKNEKRAGSNTRQKQAAVEETHKQRWPVQERAKCIGRYNIPHTHTHTHPHTPNPTPQKQTDKESHVSAWIAPTYRSQSMWR